MKRSLVVVLLLMYTFFSHAKALEKEGWNLMAVCQDMSMNDINMTGLIEVQSQDGEALYSGEDFEFSDLTELQAGYGYWVNGSLGSGFKTGEAGAKLGNPLPKEGWNLMAMCEDKAYTDINLSGLVEIQSQDGFALYSGEDFEFSDLTTLTYGSGYWVNGTQGTEFISKEGLAIPSSYIYPTLNSVGEIVVSTYDNFTIKLFSNEEVIVDSQAKHVKVVVYVNGEEKPFLNIMEGYRGKSVIAGLYDHSDKLVSLSETILIAESGVTQINLTLNEVDENNSSFESRIVGETLYFANLSGTIGERTYNVDGTFKGHLIFGDTTELNTFGTYNINANVVSLTRTSPSDYAFTLTYLGETSGGMEVAINESSSSILFTTIEARDNYVNLLKNKPVFTRGILNELGRTWNVYAASTSTTGEHYWEGATFEFDLTTLVAQHGLVQNITSSELQSDYNITESGELTFYDVNDNYTSYVSIVEMSEANMTVCWSDTPNSTCSPESYEYVYFDFSTAQSILASLNGNIIQIDDTNLTAAMRILENINFETDDIGSALSDARNLLESADANDKEAQVGLALFALAEITNSSEIGELINITLDGTYDYSDNLPKLLDANGSIIELIDNLTQFSEISTTVLHNTAEQLVVIASAFEDVFVDGTYVFSYSDINITANQSLAIRARLLAVASNLEYVASFRNLSAEDIKPRELVANEVKQSKVTGVIEYNNIASNPVSILNRTDVGSLEDAERLGNAKTLLIHSLALLTAMDSSEEDVAVQADIVEVQERALEINASLHGVSSFVIEKNNYGKVEKVHLNLSAMFDVSSALDMTHTLGHDFSYKPRHEYFNGQEYITGEYSLSVSQEHNEPMSAVWISEENGTVLPYVEYQMPRPNLEIVPTMPTGSDSHIPLIITKVEVIENNETTNYLGDDVLRYSFNGLDLYSQSSENYYQRSEDMNITVYVDARNRIPYSISPTYTFEFFGPDWMHMVDVNETTVRVTADAGESGSAYYSIQVRDNFGHSQRIYQSIYIDTPYAYINLSENDISLNQGETRTVTLTTEYVELLRLIPAPDFIVLEGNEITISPTTDTSIGHYEIVIEANSTVSNEVVYQFLQIDVNEGDTSSVTLPDGYVYRGINNLGAELETTIDLNALLYTVRIYSDSEVTANDQASHVGIFMNINGQSTLFQIQPLQPTTTDYNVVVAVYDETDTLVAVSEITAISGNTPISVSF